MLKRLFVSLLILSFWVALLPSAQALILGGDIPQLESGTGYESTDPCGYVMGVSSGYHDRYVDLTEVTNSDQACVDLGGDFYSSAGLFSSRASLGFLKTRASSTSLTIDFAWSGGSSANQVYVDQSTGEWRGYAKFTSGVPAGKEWIWFDWNCSALTDAAAKGACTSERASKYRVKTNMDTGVVTGYAWNDHYGFLSFNQLKAELPPQVIMTYVDILATESDLDADDVTAETAPLADGYDSWRIRVQFQDMNTGDYLDETDISSIQITEVATSDSQIYLNQVENSGDAVETDYLNLYLGCSDSSIPCVQTEDDGSTSFNRYIFAGSPTSNVLGLNDDTDAAIEYHSDRGGCRWIYRDQWEEADSVGFRKKCPNPGGTYASKEDYFYERVNNRNKYEIDYVVLTVAFTGTGSTEMYSWDDSSTGGSALQKVSLAAGNSYYYTPASGYGELSYRPRYQITQFEAFYDGDYHQDISSDTGVTGMYLHTIATISNTSAAYQGTYSGDAKPSYSVNYQMDVTSSTGSDPLITDRFLLIDTDTPPNSATSGDVEETWREDSVPKGYSGTSYERKYAIGYGQKASNCATVAGCGTFTNTVSAPTAEQWVCDGAGEKRFSDNSCYYTEYLPHIDRHQDPESMLVIGAINSTLDDDDLEDAASTVGTTLSVLGTTETIKLRNKMYAQVLRYTLGQTGGGGSLNSSMNPLGGIVSLMNGRLLFAEGDVTVQGSFAFSDKTLVVMGGDVFINGDITGGRLGIVAFRKNGSGGNVYVNNTVNNIYANLFLDGGLFSYKTAPSATDYPTWATDEARVEALMHQLYLKGSLVSRNTVNGASDATASSWNLGDGNTTSSYDVAREYDLNKIRQFRLCYGLNGDGTIDYSTTEVCEEGEALSEYGEDNGVYNSFVIEYSPASDLPIFTAGNGLFN